MDIGSHLRKFRKKKGMSQQELADELNLSRTAVSKIENGLQKVEIETFRDWAILTNCDVQAAIILFGADLFANTSQFLSMIPAYVQPIGTLNFLM